MSGKFSKKTKKRQAQSRRKKGGKNLHIGWICAAILLALTGLALLFLLPQTKDPDVPEPTESASVTEDTTHNTDMTSETESEPATDAPTEQVLIDRLEQMDLDLGNGLLVTEIGKYTGIYMEDGSDEIVTGIMMIVVSNTGERDIQYAEILLTGENGETASFSVSTLPAGESAVLLEKSRLAYSNDLIYSDGIADNVAVFAGPLNLCEGVLEFYMVGGALNIKNISDEDITGAIRIFYKNSAADMLYGGITYLARVEGGLKAGEVRQIMPGHFSAEGSRIMFVTVE